MQAKRWIISDCDEEQREILSQQLAVSPYIAEILLKRGIKTYQESIEFLNPQLQNLSHPLEILNMAAAAEKIWQSIEKKEKITVYGDYDVDGMCASAILYEGLKDLGADASCYVPDRIEEGYGLNQKAIESIAQKGCGLLVTVDCGISSAKEVAFARKLGLEVVVTDHHQLPEVLPNCIIVNPALAVEKTAKWSNLCGAGVSFKLVQALNIYKYGEKELWEKTKKLLDLTALATIADIVPLKGDNRILVKFGLEVLQQGGRVGLKELAKVAGGNYPYEITPMFASFGLAPRLNACGRIGNVRTGLELLLTKDKNKAWAIAKKLDDENRDRQNIEREIYEEVLEIIEQNHLDARRGIVVCGENWHPGVIGIVASRLAEKFYTPTIIFTKINDIYKGSGRSIEGFHLQQGLSKCADILESFGGHAQAAGLSIKKEKVAEFIQRFGDLLAQSDDQIFLPKIKVDCVLSKDSINYNFYNELNRLQPFGMQNPAPVFVLRGLKASESREVGANGDHLKVKFIAYKGDINAIGFKKAYLADLVSHKKVDVAFNLEKNNFNGHTTLQLNICDIKSQERSDELNMLDKLFFYSEEYLKDDPYKHLAEKNEFYTKIVGVTFENRQSLLADLQEGQELALKREKNNEYDPNAVAVYAQENHLGYLKREIARRIAPNIDEGIIYQAMVTQITGLNKDNLGVNIFIFRRQNTNFSDEQLCEQRRAQLEKLSAEEIEQEIKKTLLGDNDYRPKQREALQALLEGKNVFLIMGTGRGKSAVFQSYGAYLALKEKKRTVIIYPLRALVNDQYQRLKEKMNRLGVDAVKATGEMSSEERTEFFYKLAHEGADIVLTTPEFFYCNRRHFLNEGKVDFIVLDEAHHLSQRRKGYRQMVKFLNGFSGQILAVTATANDEVWQKIKESIKFEQLVVDKHIRENLILDDQRGVKEKIGWLAELLANEEKTIVYVNSRRKAVEIAQSLRERCQNQDLQRQICYYHGGLESRDRKMIENNFRSGKLKFIVSTSAFGEGIDIGDIKHVVLYHLSFSCEEYNQLAGRAGRDGEKAYIHLLYNEKDKRVNELLLAESCPQREVLVNFYKVLRTLGRKGEIKMTNEELAHSAKIKGFSEKAVSHWLGIFEELGFLEREVSGSKRTIILNERPNKANLEDSLRYTEGLAELDDYEKYLSVAFTANTEELLQAVNRPIYPQNLQGGERDEI